MKKRNLISILMVILVVNLPVAVSSGILSYRIAGKDAVNKAVREKDVLDVEAVVFINGDPQITPDQLWLGSNIQFDSCIEDINGFLCRLKFPKSGEKDFRDKQPFAINLHDDSHGTPPGSYSLADSVSGYIVIDKYPPRIEISLDKAKSQTRIKVSFKAYDDSYELNKYEECAGLKIIHFFTDDKKIDIIFDYDENQCYVEESFELNVSSVLERKYTVNVEAVDYLGHKTTDSFDIVVDRTGAIFTNPRFLDGYGNEINHIGNNFVDVIVMVDTSDDVKVDTVKADLSSLNDKENYKEFPGTCFKESDIMSCEWNIRIAPTAYGSKTLIFKGEDDIGNYNEQSFSKLIQRDVEGPRALKLQTGLTSNNVNYLRRVNNTIEIIFSETGVGLNPKDILLDISALGGPNSLRADSCEQGWKCIWKNLNFAAGDGKYFVSLNPNTRDILGNKLKESFAKEVVLDTSSPAIVSIEVNTVGGGLMTYEGFTTYGDSLEIIAKLYEPGQIADAYGDFSAFISDAYVVQADDCEDIGDGIWECRWITYPIDKTGYIRDNIKLSFRDYLGNTASFEKEITVYGIQDSYTDYWTHSLQCSPSAIDREVTSLVEQRIYCHVNLIGNAATVSINMDECTGDDSIKYVRKKELLNNQQGSTDPYIKIVLNAADIQANALRISCPLIIISQSGNKVTSIPEIEEVNIEIPFYNLPLGEYGKNMEAKIEDAIDDATGGVWEVMTSLNKLVFYSERICSLLTMVNNIASFFRAIGMFKRTAAETLLAIRPDVASGLDKAGQTDQTVAEVLNNEIKEGWIVSETGKINKFCKFISCRLFYEGEWLGGIGEWQKNVLEYANLVATGGGLGESIGLGDKGVNAYTYEGPEERGGIGRQVFLRGGKLNPKDSIVLSFATLCIPGIVHNMDKYRQIKCMYADCLQTSVETGVPVSACEDAKEYETCKYVYGEVFQLLPFTGLLDYFIGLVKGVLYSPFGIVDLVIGKMCMAPITTPYAGKVANICLLKEVAGMIADIWSDLANMKDDWKIKTDYCSRIEEED